MTGNGFKTPTLTRSVCEGIGMSSVESPSLTLRVSVEAKGPMTNDQ